MIRRFGCQEENKKVISYWPLGFLSSSISFSLFHNGQHKDLPCEFSDAIYSEAGHEGRERVLSSSSGTKPTLGTEALRYFHSRSSFLALHCCTKTSQGNHTKNPQGGCSISPHERRMGCMGSRRARLGPRAGHDLLAHSQACLVSESAGPAASFCTPQSSQPGPGDTRRIPGISRDAWKLTENGLIEGNVIHFHKTICHQYWDMSPF